MIGHSFPTLEEKPYISTMVKNRIIPTVGICVLIPLWVSAQGPAPNAAPSAAANAPATATATAPGAVPASGFDGTGATANSAAGAATPAAPPTEAELTLDEAAAKVAALESVSAELEQDVKMLKQQFKIRGKYLKAPGGKIFLSLVVSGLPGSTGEMKQVCDGVAIWDVQQLLGNKYYRKVTLGPVLEKLKSPELDAAAREQVLTRLGIEGPDVLLTGLRKAIHFDQKSEGTHQGRPVWILRGTWQDRQGLLGPNQQPLNPKAPLPAYIPSQATLYLGKEDGWPYYVRLAGKMPSVLQDTRRVGPDGRPIGSRASIQTIEASIIEMAYSVVSLTPRFDGKEFVYVPPANVRIEDSTEAVISELEQVIQMKIAQKKAETAKSEPLLEQAIEVPKIAPPPESSGGPTPPPLSRPK
jgi:hypothetical protein